MVIVFSFQCEWYNNYFIEVAQLFSDRRRTLINPGYICTLLNIAIHSYCDHLHLDLKLLEGCIPALSNNCFLAFWFVIIFTWALTPQTHFKHWLSVRLAYIIQRTQYFLCFRRLQTIEFNIPEWLIINNLYITFL